jgi:hypothetical protein
VFLFSLIYIVFNFSSADKQAEKITVVGLPVKGLIKTLQCSVLCSSENYFNCVNDFNVHQLSIIFLAHQCSIQGLEL